MAKDSRGFSARAVLNAPPAERQHILRRFWLPMVLLLALAAGGLTGIVAAYQLNYSRAANEVAALATYRPSFVTRVYADDGETVIGEFALEKRIPLKYEEIPQVMKNAILAVEDVRFYDHVGIDPIRIIGAAWKNLTSDKVEGGSTLTQQLAKNLFTLNPQLDGSLATFHPLVRRIVQKNKEWMISIHLERNFTKEEIIAMYLNTAIDRALRLYVLSPLLMIFRCFYIARIEKPFPSDPPLMRGKRKRKKFMMGVKQQQKRVPVYGATLCDLFLGWQRRPDAYRASGRAHSLSLHRPSHVHSGGTRRCP